MKYLNPFLPKEIRYYYFINIYIYIEIGLQVGEIFVFQFQYRQSFFNFCIYFQKKYSFLIAIFHFFV